MTHTQIDQIAARNVELQKEAQAAEDAKKAMEELRAADQKEISDLKVKLGQAVHDKTVAERKCSEAEDLNARARAQLKRLKDQSGMIGKLEASNKAFKERVQALETAEKQRAGTPAMKAQLAALKAERKAQKESYEGIWQERKVIGEAHELLKKHAGTFVKELVMLAQEPEEKEARKAFRRRKKIWLEFIKELQN